MAKQLTRIQQRQLLAQHDTILRAAYEFRLRNPDAELEELVSIGTMAAIHAVMTWDPNRGELSRHVSILARTAIGRHLAKESTGLRSGWGNGGAGEVKPKLRISSAEPDSSHARFHALSVDDEVDRMDDRLAAKELWAQLEEEDRWWLRQHIEGWSLAIVARRAKCKLDYAQARTEVAIMRARRLHEGTPRGRGWAGARCICTTMADNLRPGCASPAGVDTSRSCTICGRRP